MSLAGHYAKLYFWQISHIQYDHNFAFTSDTHSLMFNGIEAAIFCDKIKASNLDSHHSRVCNGSLLEF